MNLRVPPGLAHSCLTLDAFSISFDLSPPLARAVNVPTQLHSASSCQAETAFPNPYTVTSYENAGDWSLRRFLLCPCSSSDHRSSRPGLRRGPGRPEHSVIRRHRRTDIRVSPNHASFGGAKGEASGCPESSCRQAAPSFQSSGCPAFCIDGRVDDESPSVLELCIFGLRRG